MADSEDDGVKTEIRIEIDDGSPFVGEWKVGPDGFAFRNGRNVVGVSEAAIPPGFVRRITSIGFDPADPNKLIVEYTDAQVCRMTEMTHTFTPGSNAVDEWIAAAEKLRPTA